MFASLLRQIRDVNRRYAKPEIQMTPLVTFSLLGLRVYLFLLIGLMIFKFILAARH